MDGFSTHIPYSMFKVSRSIQFSEFVIADKTIAFQSFMWRALNYLYLLFNQTRKIWIVKWSTENIISNARRRPDRGDVSSIDKRFGAVHFAIWKLKNWTTIPAWSLWNGYAYVKRSRLIITQKPAMFPQCCQASVNLEIGLPFWISLL